MISRRYTFCGLAALALLNKVHVINLPNLLVSFTVTDNESVIFFMVFSLFYFGRK